LSKKRKISHYRLDPETQKAVEFLKRTMRRLQSGMTIPMVMASIEPENQPDGTVAVRAKVATANVSDGKNAFLINSLLMHLQAIGAIVEQQPKKDPTA
jgi:hypothetical protein